MKRFLLVLVTTITLAAGTVAQTRPAAMPPRPDPPPKAEEAKTKPPNFDLDQYVFGMLKRGPK